MRFGFFPPARPYHEKCDIRRDGHAENPTLKLTLVDTLIMPIYYKIILSSRGSRDSKIFKTLNFCGLPDMCHLFRFGKGPSKMSDQKMSG